MIFIKNTGQLVFNIIYYNSNWFLFYNLNVSIILLLKPLEPLISDILSEQEGNSLLKLNSHFHQWEI